MDPMKQKRDEFAKKVVQEIQDHRDLDKELDEVKRKRDAMLQMLEERCGQIVMGFRAKQTKPEDVVRVRFAVLSWLWKDRASKVARIAELEERITTLLGGSDESTSTS